MNWFLELFFIVFGLGLVFFWRRTGPVAASQQEKFLAAFGIRVDFTKGWIIRGFQYSFALIGLAFTTFGVLLASGLLVLGNH